MITAADYTVSERGCWEWRHSRVRGYGQKWIPALQSQRGAHRVMYEQEVGPIPAGLFVLHHCDNPCCINPEHLYTGTHADNTRDMVVRGRAPGNSMPGVRNPATKLTEAQVSQIRAMRESGTSYRQIARAVGTISFQQVANICKGHCWAP